MEIYNIDTIKDKISKQQYDTALDCLRKINITNVNRDDVNFCFGRAYFYLNQINNAEKYFLKIVKSKDIVIKDYSKFYLVKIFLINKRYTKVFNLLKTIENTEIKNKSKEFDGYLENITHKDRVNLVRIIKNETVTLKCPDCGDPISEKELFCTKCGCKLKNKCDKCGFVNELDDKYCAKCGNKL